MPLEVSLVTGMSSVNMPLKPNGRPGRSALGFGRSFPVRDIGIISRKPGQLRTMSRWDNDLLSLWRLLLACVTVDPLLVRLLRQKFAVKLMVEGRNMQMVPSSTTCSKMKARPSCSRNSKK